MGVTWGQAREMLHELALELDKSREQYLLMILQRLTSSYFSTLLHCGLFNYLTIHLEKKSGVVALVKIVLVQFAPVRFASGVNRKIKQMCFYQEVEQS